MRWPKRKWRKAKRNPDLTPADYEQAQREARRALAFKLKNWWSKTSKEERENHVQEVVVRWFASGQREDFDKLADDYVKELRGYLEREVSSPKRGGERPGVRQPIEPHSVHAAEVEVEPEAPLTVIEAVDAYLRSSDPSDRVRGVLIGLHFGIPVVLRQPRRFLGYPPRRSAKKFHPRRSLECPTCRSIARFIRVRGVTQVVVADLVDVLVMTLRGGD